MAPLSYVNNIILHLLDSTAEKWGFDDRRGTYDTNTNTKSRA